MNGQDFIKYATNLLQNDPLARFVDVDMSPSSAFYNMNLLPFSILAKPVFDLHDDMVNSMSLDTLTGTMLDDFSTMFFRPRQTKAYVTLEVKIYIPYTTSILEPLPVLTTDEFRTSQNILFYPIQDYIFAPATLNTEVLTDGNTYFVASILTASATAASQIPENSITSTTIIYQTTLKVNNVSKSSVPLAAETDNQFKASLKNALVNRNGLSASSLITNLSTAFPFASFQPIGYGDPEMQRDIAVAGQYWSGHFGGMTDVYTSAQLVSATFTVTANLNSTNDGYIFKMQAYKGFDWNGSDQAYPLPQSVLPWTQITNLDGTPNNNLPTLPVVVIDWDNSTLNGVAGHFTKNSANDVEYIITVGPDPVELSYGKNFRYSQFENIQIEVKSANIGSTAEIVLKYFTLPSIAAMQTYVDQNRIMNSNILIKSFIPIEVETLEIVYDKSIVIDTSAWATTIASIINTWTVNSPIAFSDLLNGFPAKYRTDEIYLDSSASFPFTFDSNGLITGLNSSTTTYPCYAKIRMNNIDGSSQVYVSTRQLAPRYTTSGLSSSFRTCKYFINPANIKFTPGSW